ncbi:MAG TPA: hypothetical protein VHE23_05070, partial [Candidatus Acidoferrales bacterium]|nr:hypothetical protein [Candidatus Acidoferrales bacterium]
TLILRLRDTYGVTSLLATHRLQDGFGLANFLFDPQSGRVLHVNGTSPGAAGPDGALTKFLVLREGRVYFEGSPEEIAKAEDPYLRRFLV